MPHIKDVCDGLSITITLSSEPLIAMKINCYVRGDVPQNAFILDIDDDKTVDDLKKAVRENKRPNFDDANSLILWNVSVPINRNLKNSVEALNLLESDALYTHEILSDIFSDLKKNCVHILIDRPHSSELLYNIPSARVPQL